MTMYSSRPPFNAIPAQSNPTNWILVAIRKGRDPRVGYPIRHWINQLARGVTPRNLDATDPEIVHACRVLARLAGFRVHEKPNRTVPTVGAASTTSFVVAT